MTKQSIKTAPINTTPAGTALPVMWDKVAYQAGVDKCHTAMKDVQALVTETSIQALMHLEAHKDVATLNRFIVGFPKGFKRNSMASWALAYGCVKVNQDQGTAKNSPLMYDKMKVVKMDEAIADPWFNHMPEKEISDVFDLQKAIHMLLQRAKGKVIKIHGQAIDSQRATDLLKSIGAAVGETFEGEPLPPEAALVVPPAEVVEAPAKKATAKA